MEMRQQQSNKNTHTHKNETYKTLRKQKTDMKKEKQHREDHFKWRHFAERKYFWILFYGQPQSNNRI